MGVRRFEDLDAWKLADELKKKVYALLDRSGAARDRRFYDQLTDSAASAPSNLSEGFGYYRHPEFAKHARIAKSSLMETQSHLEVSTPESPAPEPPAPAPAPGTSTQH
jgi:four helix bundle protein